MPAHRIRRLAKQTRAHLLVASPQLLRSSAIFLREPWPPLDRMTCRWCRSEVRDCLPARAAFYWSQEIQLPTFRWLRRRGGEQSPSAPQLVWKSAARDILAWWQRPAPDLASIRAEPLRLNPVWDRGQLQPQTEKRSRTESEMEAPALAKMQVSAQESGEQKDAWHRSS